MDTRLVMAMALNIIGVLLVPVNERLVTVAFLRTPLLFLRHKNVDSTRS